MKKNIVVTGYNKTDVTKNNAIIAKWNLSNIQEYAHSIDADFIALDVNNNLEVFKMIPLLNECDRVAWIDMDLLIHKQRFPNIFSYSNSNIALVSEDNSLQSKIQKLKFLTSDPEVLNTTRSICGCLIVIDRLVLDHFTKISEILSKYPNYLQESNELIWMILDRYIKFDSFYSFENNLCGFIDKKQFIVDHDFTQYKSIHLSWYFKKRFGGNLTLSTLVNSIILKDIYESFNRDDNVGVSFSLNKWSKIIEEYYR